MRRMIALTALVGLLTFPLCVNAAKTAQSTSVSDTEQQNQSNPPANGDVENSSTKPAKSLMDDSPSLGEQVLKKPSADVTDLVVEQQRKDMQLAHPMPACRSTSVKKKLKNELTRFYNQMGSQRPVMRRWQKILVTSLDNIGPAKLSKLTYQDNGLVLFEKNKITVKNNIEESLVKLCSVNWLAERELFVLLVQNPQAPKHWGGLMFGYPGAGNSEPLRFNLDFLKYK